LERETGIDQSWYSRWAGRELRDSYKKYPTDKGHAEKLAGVLGLPAPVAPVEPAPSKALPRRLMIDIESAPTRASVWRRWKQNVHPSQVIRRGYVLAWCARWYGEETIITCSQADFGKEGTEDDREVVESAYELFEKADIIIAHNGDRFDIPYLKRQWIKYNLPPVSPYRSADTLKMARSSCKFEANSLEELARFFGLEGKIETGGQELWNRCEAGEIKAYEEMVTYCCGDIELLDFVYRKLLPYAKNHPNVALYGMSIKPRCTRCGCDDLEPLKKLYYTNTRAYSAFRCKDPDCRSVVRSRVHAKSPEEMSNVMAQGIQ
jgi:hypothetical protein